MAIFTVIRTVDGKDHAVNCTLDEATARLSGGLGRFEMYYGGGIMVINKDHVISVNQLEDGND